MNSSDVSKHEANALIDGSTEKSEQKDGQLVKFTKYDRRSFSYATTFDEPWKVAFIRVIEAFTGKYSILRAVRKLEREGTPQGQAIWDACLNVIGIELTTPEYQINRIPKEGPVVIVANHPHGMIDGMIFGALIGRVRPDYRILTRSLLTVIDEVTGSFMIPVPFPHDPDAQRKMVEMRSKAMAHLAGGGVVALFPSGVVASSDTWFGPVIEREWNVFTSKMIRKSGARVVPMRFPGQNSRAYQIASRISPILRQGLLLHEIANTFNKPQGPVIGDPIPTHEIEQRAANPRQFMSWLREHTLALQD